MKRSPAFSVMIAVLALMLLIGAGWGVVRLWRSPHWGVAEQSPIHSAVLADDLTQAKALIPKAPAGSADAQLFYARSAAMAEFLIASGASSNARAHGNYTPLHFAAVYHLGDVVTVLLAHGADPNAVDDGKTTPLMLAVGFGGDPDAGFENNGIKMSEARQLTVIRMLLAAGAKVDMRDSGGMTALCRATTRFNAKEVVPVLVEAGSDVNARSVGKETPLHGAAFCGDLQTVRYLVEHGADVTVKEWQGKTPRDCVQGTGPDADEMRRLLTK